MDQNEIEALVQKDDLNTYHEIDCYIRTMIKDSLRWMKYDVRKDGENQSLQKEYKTFKIISKAIDENSDKMLTFQFLNKQFQSFPIIREYLEQYEILLEQEYEDIRKLNLLSDLTEVMRGNKLLKEVKAKLVFGTYLQNSYDTEFGIVTLGHMSRQLPTSSLESLNNNLSREVIRNSHFIAIEYAKILEADIYTGYINSQIPNLRTMCSWLEKNDNCYDLNTGIVMPKKQYYHFYNPEVINKVSYHDVKQVKNMVGNVPYICYLAYEKLNQNTCYQKKRQL